MDTLNSLNIIKQELIKQKELLEEQGIVVNVANTNPSPSEITTALGGITTDFAQADATPEDVRAGKTFFGNSNKVQTGTLDLSLIDTQQDIINCFITGASSCEIFIPEDPKYTTIKKYAFAGSKSDNRPFYKQDLTIPSNITTIYDGAFQFTDITGKVVIPSTCKQIGSNVFQSCNLTEVVANGGLTKSSTNTFNDCPNLKKVTINAPITHIANNLFSFGTGIEEIHLPSTLTYIGSTPFYRTYYIIMLRFTSTTPVTLSSGTFADIKNASIVVPYLNYDAYFTATNYQQYSNPMFGWGDFVAGETLPSTSADGLYTITWHTTLDDAKNVTNPITSCTEDAMLYGVFTEIITEE